MSAYLSPLELQNPQVLGLPHTAWRANQLAAFETALTLHKTGGGFLFTQQPTGSGKSGVATALGAFENVTALVGTLNLVTQYHEQYSFSAIKGRQNYACADQDKILDWGGSTPPTAADCHMRAMHQCKFAGECEYLIIKEAALAARRLVVTYPYAMLSRSVQERPGILVCDEAHAVVDEIIGFSTFEVSPRYCERWGLPDFPLPEYGEENRGDVLHPYSLNLVLAWFDASIAILAARKSREGKISRAHAAHAHLELYRESLNTLSQEDWFLEVHPSPVCVFRLRPLTAVVAAKLLFTKHKATVILMSATIGDPAPLASELGIENYAWEDYPHPIPISARPVFDLGLERMTHENIKRNPSLFRIQAQAIRAWMATLNPDWRGIILAPSYSKIRELADVLVPACPDRNFLVQKSGDTVANITESFLRYRSPGDVLIASIQGFGHGLDLRGDLARWCVVAGVPHSNPFDRYEQLRKQRNGKFGWWQAYSAIPQAAGRVSRGELDEYGEPIVNVCALADGSATTPLAYKYYPSWFAEAIQKF